mmetsp:Transcript_76119/g.150510  ORF Transcript_76119/g.150510 Transcript_76119/m.150510 type:complete len:223 (-) Transcript_76119:45-713(-)
MGEPQKVRGRGSSKFASAFGGSGLLAWTSDDPKSEPSKEAGLAPQHTSAAKSPSPGRRHGGSHHTQSRHVGTHRAGSRQRLGPDSARAGGRSPGRAGRRSRRSLGEAGGLAEEEADDKPMPATRWVRVVNVPSVLQSQHLQHLFKTSLGKVESCSLDNGIAIVCFDDPQNAVKAVEKYDTGEINGCTISVQLHFPQPPRQQQSRGSRRDRGTVRRSRSRRRR